MMPFGAKYLQKATIYGGDGFSQTAYIAKKQAKKGDDNVKNRLRKCE